MADVAIEHFDFDHVDGGTHTLTTPVDTSRAFVQMLSGGSRPSGSGPIGTTSNTNTDRSAAVELTATDTLTGHIAANVNVKSMGQVWSYTGPRGGLHEFKVRFAGPVAVTGTQTVQSLTGVMDKDRCVPFLGGITYSTNTLEWNDACIDAYLDGNGDLVVSRGAGKNNTTTVYVSVVEFTGRAWQVGHAVSTNHDALDSTVGMNSDSTGAGGVPFTVSDWSTAMLVGYMEGDAGGEEGLGDTLTIWRPDTSTTVVCSIHQDGNARNDGDAHCHVLQNDALDVSRYVNDNYAEGNNTYTTLPWPTGAPIDVPVEELAVEWYVDTTGTGTAHMRGALGPIVTGQSSAQSWVHRSGNNVEVTFGVADLSGLLSPLTGPMRMCELGAGGLILRSVMVPDIWWLFALIDAGAPGVGTSTEWVLEV